MVDCAGNNLKSATHTSHRTAFPPKDQASREPTGIDSSQAGMVYKNDIPSLEGVLAQTSSSKKKNATGFPPPRHALSVNSRGGSRSRSCSPPTRPLPAIPIQQGQPREKNTLRVQSSQQHHLSQGPKNTSPQAPLQSQHPLRNHLPSNTLPPPQQAQVKYPLMRKPVRMPFPYRNSSASPQAQPCYHGKVMPPLPQFNAITLSPSPTSGGAMESASSSLTRSLGGAGERVSLGMDLRPTGDLGGEDRWIGIMASKEFGPHMRSRVHALMTEPSGAEGFLKPSFDVQKERELSTRVEPRPPRVLSVIDYEDVTDPVTKPEASRVSRFREELIIDEEDIADFERWKEMKRLDNQRYAAATQVANSDPRSPLQLPSTPMRNITDSMPRIFLRRIASFGPRRNSRGEEEEEGKEPELWKRQSATSLMKRVTSLSCLSVSGDNFAEAPTLESAPAVSSLTSPPTPVRTTIAVPPPIRPQRPVRSPLNFHAGRMEFEESNPFAYVEFQRPMDAFRGLKRWSWYNKPEGRSFNMDPNWDNAKKELGRLDVADAQIRSIIADDEDMPEYVELIREIEKELTSRESRKDNGTSSPHMGIDLNNAPMILRHLEECREDALMPMIEARVLESIEGRDEVDVPVMLEEDDSDDSDEGVGSRSFDCAAAPNGQMTFLISDSEDEGVEEEAVIGAYSSHRRYPRGK